MASKCTLRPPTICHLTRLKSTLKNCPPVLQAGWADAVPASSQLWGRGRPGERAPSSAWHGSFRRGHHHQHTHTHSHRYRHQHLPRYGSCTDAHTRTHTDMPDTCLMFWYTLPSFRLWGSAPVFLLSAQPHWVSVGQTDLRWPPGYWLFWVNTDYRWSICCRLTSGTDRGLYCFVSFSGQVKH